MLSYLLSLPTLFLCIAIVAVLFVAAYVSIVLFSFLKAQLCHIRAARFDKWARANRVGPFLTTNEYLARHEYDDFEDSPEWASLVRLVNDRSPKDLQRVLQTMPPKRLAERKRW